MITSERNKGWNRFKRTKHDSDLDLKKWIDNTHNYKRKTMKKWIDNTHKYKPRSKKC